MQGLMQGSMQRSMQGSMRKVQVQHGPPRTPRSLSNTMRVPSGVNPLRVSLAVFEVKRTASPPVAAARQRSPRQLKTRIVPSGESAGKRGRSTVAALTNDEIKAGSVIATIRDKGKEPVARGGESRSRCMLLSSPV